MIYALVLPAAVVLHPNLGYQALVSISSGQRNLMKTYHYEAITGGITKIASKKKWILLDKLDRFRKITILRPYFSNKLFSKLNLSKNVFNKSWCPKLIFFNEIFLRKIQTIFGLEK